MREWWRTKKPRHPMDRRTRMFLIEFGTIILIAGVISALMTIGILYL